MSTTLNDAEIEGMLAARAAGLLVGVDDETAEQLAHIEDQRVIEERRAQFLAVETGKELMRLRARRAAQRQLDAEDRPPAPPFDAGTLAAVLARPPEPAFRIEHLMPWESAALIVAQRKTGKTTLEINLARSLLTGAPFLGRFAVQPITGKVAILNFEVSAHQLARWASEAGVPQDRLVLVNLRGRRNPLGIDEDRAALATLLRQHNVESLIVDPFGRAYTGTSQNDSGEVGAWLADLDTFARSEVGATDLVLSAHAGWEAERTRGASALEDWADVIITLVRDKDDASARFLRAEGRDVDVEEDRLAFDPATRALSLAGTGDRQQSRAALRVTAITQAVVGVVSRQPGINTAGIEKALRELGFGMQRGEVGKAARSAVANGLLRSEAGPRNSVLYFADQSGDSPAVPAVPSAPAVRLGSSPHPSIGGGTSTTTTQGLAKVVRLNQNRTPLESEHPEEGAPAPTAGPTAEQARLLAEIDGLPDPTGGES